MTDTDTTGKVVTLEKGVIVTDIGPAPQGKYLRLCIEDKTGERHLILDRVIEELPETLRRDSLPEWIY